MNNGFIKLSRDLIKAVGLNNAVVLCELIGTEEMHREKGASKVFVQNKRLQEYTGLSRKTVYSCIDDLEKLHLIEVERHAEKNKNKYKCRLGLINAVVNFTASHDGIKKEWLLKRDEKTLQQFLSSVKNDTTPTANSGNINTSNSGKTDTIKDTNEDTVSSKISRKSTISAQPFIVGERKNKTFEHLDVFENKELNAKVEKLFIAMDYQTKNDIFKRIEENHYIALFIANYMLAFEQHKGGEYSKPKTPAKALKLINNIEAVLEALDIQNTGDYPTVEEWNDADNTLKACNDYIFNEINIQGDYSIFMLTSNTEFYRNAFYKELY